MANQPFTATILGIPSIPSITEVNVRSAAGTNQTLLFKIALGVRAAVLDVQPDVQSQQINNKIYQWFRLSFPGGTNGWVRDDLINIEGDGSSFGYGVITQPVLAFNLTRKTVSPPPSTTPTPPPATTPPPSTGTPGAAQIIVQGIGNSQINVRTGPSTTYAPAGQLPFNSRADILGVRADERFPNNLRWINIRASSLTGWVREDLVKLDGDFPSFGLGFRDLYPAPMVNYQWQRDFNQDRNYPDVVHDGWDLSATVGEPILAGTNGGTVVRVSRCSKCTPDKPSTVSQGIPVGTTSVFSDPGWGFGYGNFIIVRYLSDLLPASTRQGLTNRGLTGAHLYVMYAHLNTLEASEGQTLAPRTRFATCGNTGNSTGSHLHLEVRASLNANDTNWAGMRPNLLTPGVLFLR